MDYNKVIKLIINNPANNLSKTSIDLLETMAISLQLSEEKAFSLQGVIASLLCVDSEGLSFIREGETYNLLEENDTLYRITDDDGDDFWYDKKHFVKN